MMTRPMSLLLVLLAAIAVTIPIRVQARTSDPRAVAILQQSLIALGGARGLAAIPDFTASGTITYFLAGEQVHGTAVVRARGSD